jgi:hypothetical protein
MLLFAFERQLTSGSVCSADGFGISWYTEARSQFNPLTDDKSTLDFETDEDETMINDNLFLPYVIGPRPTIYNTTCTKPWVFIAFVPCERFILLVASQI